MQLSLQTKITLQSILATLIVAIALGWLAFTKFNDSNHESINSESQSQASAISIYSELVFGSRSDYANGS